MGTRKIILAAVIAIVAIVALVMLVMPRDEQAATAPDEASQSTAGAESTDQPSETAVFTAEEVATHDNASDCWTIINGNVYNVSSFISSHPGGEEILRACGIDATTLFTQRQTEDGESVGSGTPHSSAARSQLESLQIGRLAD